MVRYEVRTAAAGSLKWRSPIEPFSKPPTAIRKSSFPDADHHKVELTRIIRPALVVEEASAARIVTELRDRDVSRGGCWNASSTIWQRYSGAWDGIGSTRGSAQLVGTIAVAYSMPIRDYITIYRVTVTEAGIEAGFTVESLCDDALHYGGLTFNDCARADLMEPPRADPFHARR